MSTSLSLLPQPAAAAEQHAALGLHLPKRLDDATHTAHPGAQWFPTATLGLFVHWGIASVHGGLDLSWSMIANTTYDSAARGKNKLTPNEYWKLAERFRPDAWDPEPWIVAAKAAGFQYAVLTTMHHDGYTLWPSAYGEMGVQTFLGGRDLVAPFVDACRRHGLRVGLYYSPPDWYFDREVMSFNYRSGKPGEYADRPAFDADHRPTTLPQASPEHIALRRAMFHGRVSELLTRYGAIDLLWLDGGDDDNDLRDLARKLQPHIVINSRSCDGDYGSTECMLPRERPQGWFETCHCWQSSDILDPRGGTVDFWGYLSDESYKQTAWMLECLVKLRAWDANFLVNVGPRPNGEMPDIVFERLAETATWMRHSGRSVIGAKGWAHAERANVPVTLSGRTLYMHAAPQSDGVLTVAGIERPSGVTLLRTGEAMPYTWTPEGDLTVIVPPSMRSDSVDVVEVRGAGLSVRGDLIPLTPLPLG